LCQTAGGWQADFVGVLDQEFDAEGDKKFIIAVSFEATVICAATRFSDRSDIGADWANSGPHLCKKRFIK